MDTYSENQERHVLIVNSGDRRAYALEAAAYSVGRDSTNAIVLDFETVSRQHALFLRVPNPNTQRYEYRIIDGNAEGKASANGVFINGEAIKSHTLKNGDSVEFGQHVKAAYLTLSMGEAEFVNYLESISYQSLKSELVDNKATMVGIGFDEMFSDTPTTVAVNSQQRTSRKKNAKWQETLHDADKFDQSSNHPHNIANTGEKFAQNRSPFRLWMALVGGVVALGLAGGAFLLLRPTPTEQSSPTESSPASIDALD